MMRVVNLISPNWHPADSYGRIAHELVAGLEAGGYYVNQFGPDAPQHPIRPALGGIFLGYPTLHEKGIANYALAGVGARLAITMFESTKLPDGWSSTLNECDRVVVPSDFLVDVFKNSGVDAPIEVVPLGMSAAFTKTVEPRQALDTEPFTFICIGDRGLRKNWHLVTWAFESAFGKDMKYRLIIKLRKPYIKIKNPNIDVVVGDYSDEEMADLYRKAHVMVFPSSGEGFGLPPREFAATGGIALTTNWGGTADDVHQWGIPLPYLMVDAWETIADWHGKLGQWATVDVDMLASKMKRVANHYQRYVDFGVDAAEFVRGHYRWDTFADHMRKAWESIIAEKELAHASNGHRKGTHPA